MQTKYFKQFTILAFVLLAGGCAYTPHDVSMTASAPIYSTERGNDVTVGLRFIDDRESKTVGQRAVGMTGSDISANSLGYHLETQIAAILERNGLRQVRKLQYHSGLSNSLLSRDSGLVPIMWM